MLPSREQNRLGLPASFITFIGALSLKGDIPPNGLHTFCLRFTVSVALTAQDSIQGVYDGG